MKKNIAHTGFCIILLISLFLFPACSGGTGGLSGGSGPDGSSEEDASSDSSPDQSVVDDDTDVDQGTEAPVVPVTGPTISSLSFNLAGAVGLAIDNSSQSSLAAGLTLGSSNLKRVNLDNSLSNAITSGSASVQNFMVAANDQIYLLLSSAIEGCILVRVDGATNEATCVDKTLSQINWSNRFGDPIQFDGQGNIYYQGSAGDKTILRENAAGTTTDLINDNISMSGFLVLNDGSVFVSGTTSSTGLSWTRVISPEGSISNLLTSLPYFLALFPDNNVYMGVSSPSSSVERYMTSTREFDSSAWINGNGAPYYFVCPAKSNDLCIYAKQILRTANGKVYSVVGVNHPRTFLQYYPVVSKTNTEIVDVTMFKSTLTYIFLAGLDINNENRLMLYDTANNTETDLLTDQDIEIYHINFLNSNDRQIVMFDGLRFSDNSYVLCQVDLTNNNALTCSKTGLNKLTDFQLFDDLKTISGGGTNSTKTYTIGGTVTGLNGTLVLQNNDADSTTLTKDGTFTFPVAVAGDYKVTVKSSPTGQTCTVSNGTGSVSGNNVDSVSVVCVGYTVGGTATGLIGTLVLQNNGSDDFLLSLNGSFAFPATLADGESYKVEVKTNPAGQTCAVAQGSGNVSSGNIGNIAIACTTTKGALVTFAGGGSSSKDGVGATTFNLSSAYSLAFDVAGNLFIGGSSRIRKVDVTGKITTVAGGGSAAGDGGAATDAQIGSVSGIAFDVSGHLYFSESGNYRVRKIDTKGIITTVAGRGSKGFSGDGEQALSAELNHPAGIALDVSGNIYIADQNNARIRKVDTKGIITTVAGGGGAIPGDGGMATSAQLGGPSAIAFDSLGNLIFADAYNPRIRKIDSNGILTTIAGDGSHGSTGDGGKATSAKFSSPQGIIFDSSDNLYIADSLNNRIRKVDTNGNITTVSGNGVIGFSGDGGDAVNAVLNYPTGVAFDSSGNLYIADSSNGRVRMIALGQ